MLFEEVATTANSLGAKGRLIETVPATLNSNCAIFVLSVIVVSVAVFKNADAIVVAAIASLILLDPPMSATTPEIASDVLSIIIATDGSTDCALAITVSIDVCSDRLISAGESTTALARAANARGEPPAPADTSIAFINVEIANPIRIATASVTGPVVSNFAALT